MKCRILLLALIYGGTCRTLALAQSPDRGFELQKKAYIKKYAWPKRPQLNGQELLFSSKTSGATRSNPSPTTSSTTIAPLNPANSPKPPAIIPSGDAPDGTSNE